MLCQKCGKNQATVHLIQNINGAKSDLWLCQNCAGETENSFFDFSAGDLFSDFFSDSMFSKNHPGLSKTCPVCGFTTKDLAVSGKPGCPKCYEIFEDEIDGIIRGIHGNAKHSGSLPGKHAEKLGVRRQIEALKKEQEEAIKVQDYEKAAEIRDTIKALESGSDGSDNGKEGK